MNAIASALLWCVVQVTVLAIGAALVYLAARRLHPRAGAAATGGALAIVLLLTVLLASPWPRWSFSVDNRVARGTTAAPTQAPAPQGDSRAEADLLSEASRPADLDSPQLAFWTTLIEGLNNPRPAPLADRPAASWLVALGLLFALGALLAGARLVWGITSVRRLARRATSIDEAPLERLVAEMQEKLQFAGPVALRESQELATPATVGWRRPIVMLPRTWRTWSDEELRAALAHELAHVAGRDYAAWLVARLAVVAHFYHPLVRWLATRLQLEQELAADLTAASLVGDRKQYLHSLATLALATPPHRVAGPVRTLIPTRSLLVRRVEMLRTNGINRPRRPVLRYATFAVVALLGLAAAGLRGPGSDVGNVALAQTPNGNEVAPVERIGLGQVPRDVTFVVSIRPVEIAAIEGFAPAVKLLDYASGIKQFGLEYREVAEIMAIKYGDDSVSGRFVIRFVDAQQLQECLQRLIAARFEKRPDADVWQRGNDLVRQVDASTLVYDHTQSIPESHLPPLRNPRPRWAEAWERYDDQVFVGILDLENTRDVLPDPKSVKLAGGIPLQMIAPVIQQTDWAIGAVAAADKLQFAGQIECDSDESATSVKKTLEAVAVLLQNAIRNQSDFAASIHARYVEALIIGMEMAEETVNSAKFTVDGDRVTFSIQPTIALTDANSLLALILPAAENARQAARQTQSTNNLRQLALAMLNYESTYKSLPPAASYTYRKNGQELKSEHPHSWRVALLPFLEQQALYNEYRFDEPWDSEANKQIMDTVVPVFQSPHDDPSSTNTSYFALTGPETVFHDEEGTRLSQVTDGLSKTLMIVEAKRPVSWTKPEDIPYAADAPVPKLGGWVPGEFVAARADGSVQRVLADTNEETLRALITKAGGESFPPLPTPQDQ